MKFERKEIIDGFTVITTSKRFLFWHIIDEYQLVKYGAGYWVKMPEGRPVIGCNKDRQLFLWNKMHKPVNG